MRCARRCGDLPRRNDGRPASRSLAGRALASLPLLPAPALLTRLGLLTTLGVLTALATPTFAESTIEDWLDRAARATHAGNTQQAAALIERAAGTAGRVAALSGLSTRLVDQGAIDTALEIAAGNAQVWLQEDAAADAAMLLSSLAAHLDDRAPAVLLALLGESQLRADQALSAVGTLERAWNAGDRQPGTQFNLASALWESGRYEAAEARLRAGLEARNDPFIWQHQLGRLLFFLGRHGEAAGALEAAARIRPQAADVQLDLAWALDGDGQLEAAEAAYGRVIAIDGDLTKAHYGLARVLTRLGKKERARATMATFQQKFAADRARFEAAVTERARLDRGWDLLRRGEAEQARDHFERLGALSEALDGLASALTALGERDRATAALEQAVRLDPENDRLRRRLAEARLATGG